MIVVVVVAALLALALLVGIVLLTVEMIRAPLGWEDADGFHEGEKP